MDKKDIFITIIFGVMIDLVGAVWYSPIAFGPMWMQMIGTTQETISSMISVHLSALVLAIVMSFAIRFLVVQLKLLKTKQVIKVTFVLWFGFVLPDVIPHYQFSGLEKGVLVIDGLHTLAMILLGITLHTLRNRKIHILI